MLLLTNNSCQVLGGVVDQSLFESNNPVSLATVLQQAQLQQKQNNNNNNNNNIQNLNPNNSINKPQSLKSTTTTTTTTTTSKTTTTTNSNPLNKSPQNKPTNQSAHAAAIPFATLPQFVVDNGVGDDDGEEDEEGGQNTKSLRKPNQPNQQNQQSKFTSTTTTTNKSIQTKPNSIPITQTNKPTNTFAVPNPIQTFKSTTVQTPIPNKTNTTTTTTTSTTTSFSSITNNTPSKPVEVIELLDSPVHQQQKKVVNNSSSNQTFTNTATNTTTMPTSMPTLTTKITTNLQTTKPLAQDDFNSDEEMPIQTKNQENHENQENDEMNDAAPIDDVEQDFEEHEQMDYGIDVSYPDDDFDEQTNFENQMEQNEESLDENEFPKPMNLKQIPQPEHIHKEIEIEDLVENKTIEHNKPFSKQITLFFDSNQQQQQQPKQPQQQQQQQQQQQRNDDEDFLFDRFGESLRDTPPAQQKPAYLFSKITSPKHLNIQTKEETNLSDEEVIVSEVPMTPLNNSLNNSSMTTNMKTNTTTTKTRSSENQFKSMLVTPLKKTEVIPIGDDVAIVENSKECSLENISQFKIGSNLIISGVSINQLYRPVNISNNKVILKLEVVQGEISKQMIVSSALVEELIEMKESEYINNRKFMEGKEKNEISLNNAEEKLKSMGIFSISVQISQQMPTITQFHNEQE